MRPPTDRRTHGVTLCRSPSAVGTRTADIYYTLHRIRHAVINLRFAPVSPSSSPISYACYYYYYYYYCDDKNNDVDETDQRCMQTSVQKTYLYAYCRPYLRVRRLARRSSFRPADTHSAGSPAELSRAHVLVVSRLLRLAPITRPCTFLSVCRALTARV